MQTITTVLMWRYILVCIEHAYLSRDRDKWTPNVSFVTSSSVLLMLDKFSKCQPFEGLNQIAYLDDWALLEINCVNVLFGIVEDLETNTACLPVTRGAKVCLVLEHLNFDTWKEKLAWHDCSTSTFTG